MGLNFEYQEGQTPIDPSEAEGLVIKSITTQKELDEFEQLNIQKAILWTYAKRLKKEQLLSEKFILDLHKKMYGDVWKWAGRYRTTEKNLGVKFYQIPVELKSLLDDCLYWIENKIFPEEEIAVRFKHKLVSIHCFSNGNGRHSRLMADLIMEKLFNQSFFTWGGRNLVKQSEHRSSYIRAVRLADQNKIQSLIDFAKS